MSQLLKGKVAVITGGTRGIGVGIARAFAKAGAAVVIAGRDSNAGHEVTRKLADHGDVEFVRADVLVKDDLDQLIRYATEKVGHLDVMCHNAGIYPEHPLTTMTDDDWRTVLDTNLTSAFWITQLCANAMRSHGGGKVIFTSSITGVRTGGIPGLAHYAASKAGMAGLMRAAAVELAPDGITVNAVEPGVVMTDALQGLDADGTLIPQIVKQVPLGRLGTVDEVGNVALFLASGLSDYITGQSIVIDGGLLLPEIQV